MMVGSAGKKNCCCFFYYLAWVITVGDVRGALFPGMGPSSVRSRLRGIIVLQSSGTSVLYLSKECVNCIWIISRRYLISSFHPILFFQLVCELVDWLQTSCLIIPSYPLCLCPESMWTCWLIADLMPDHPSYPLCLCPESRWTCWLIADLLSDYPIPSSLSVSREYVNLLIGCRPHVWSSHPILFDCVQDVCELVEWLQTSCLIIPSHPLCLCPVLISDLSALSDS